MYLKFRSTGRKTPLKNWRIKIVYSFSGLYLGLFFLGQHVRWLFSVLGLFWKMVLVSWFDAVWYYRVLSFCILVGTCQTGTFFFPNPNFSSWKWIFFSKNVCHIFSLRFPFFLNKFTYFILENAPFAFHNAWQSKKNAKNDEKALHWSTSFDLLVAQLKI